MLMGRFQELGKKGQGADGLRLQTDGRGGMLGIAELGFLSGLGSET